MSLQLGKSPEESPKMRFASRPMALTAAVVMTLAVLPGSAVAIEPQAPERLITANEAILITIRQRLAGIKQSRRPTQTEKAEAIDRTGLAKFYRSLGERRTGADAATSQSEGPLWVTEDGLTEQARRAIDEIANAAKWGLDPDDFNLAEIEELASRNLTARERVDAEMKVSLAVLKYARHARGGRMDPTDLSLDIDRKPPLLAADTVLTGAHQAEDVAAYLQGLHPRHDQFVKLRAAYLQALEDEANGIDTFAEEEKSTKRKRRRRRKAKRRLPASKRILYNMEMWRWMPEDLGEFYVKANVPEFRIRVIRDGVTVHSERMITGKVKNKTPIFSDELETIVFRPNWGVPDSIKVKEILPKLMRGKSLERQGLRAQYGGRDIDPYSVDWASVDIRNYHIYQPPGRRNALGLVKFLFPNKHAVYFHDTPTKHLFKRKVRAFSHGCMRVRDPMKMAAVLFGRDRGWGQSKIEELAKSSVNDNRIDLQRKIPVHVTYFTASVNDDGKVTFLRDIYGHEKRIQKGFDGLTHTIVKEDRSLDKFLGERVGQVASNAFEYGGPRRRGNRRWMRRIWGHD